MQTTFIVRFLYAGLLASGVAGPLLIVPGCHSEAAVAAAPPQPAGRQTPELPQGYVDARYVRPTGKRIDVKAGGDLQAALDKAQPGDTVVLEAGAVFSGSFTLPLKPADTAGWIVVESSAVADGRLAPGVRVSPDDAALMPKLEASSGPVLRTAQGAHHYRLIGLELRPGPASVSKALSWLHGFSLGGGAPAAPKAAFLANLFVIGNGDKSIETLAHHIIVDRCYLHGDPQVGARRGVAMNGRYVAVIDSYLSDFKQVGEDSQALSAWNGTGPFMIVDDYLEAAGENVLFGGTDPTIPNLVPSDIEVRGNHFSKPLAWKKDDPAYQGTPWSVKNIFELKNAQRVLVEGNLLEYNWAQSQDGFSILFTVRDQDGSAPWSVVQDVTFKDNVVRHVANGINILGYDNNHPSRQTQRIQVSNNLFEDVGGPWGPGVLLMMGDGSRDVAFSHNTSLQTGTIVFSDGRAVSGFSYTDNIAPHNRYGIIGTNKGVGVSTISAYFPGAKLRRNVIVGAAPQQYPSGNFFPKDLGGVGFARMGARDYRLAPGSAYKAGADDGGDIGVDVDQLCASLDAYDPHLGDSVPSCVAAQGH
ncbi:MAG TPA: hypothetical protein VF651_05595 [Gammaproteobacteria bacterium]